MKAYDVTIYKTFWKQWRWKIIADNGKTIAASTESFKNKKDCEYNLELTAVSAASYIHRG